MSLFRRLPLAPAIGIIRHEAVRYGPWELDYANKEVDLTLAKRRKIRAFSRDLEKLDREKEHA